MCGNCPTEVKVKKYTANTRARTRITNLGNYNFLRLRNSTSLGHKLKVAENYRSRDIYGRHYVLNSGLVLFMLYINETVVLSN